MTPRENLLKTIKCEETEWMPIVFYADRYNHPSIDSLPEDLAHVCRESFKPEGNLWEAVVPVSDYLGINEYVLNTANPYKTVCTGQVEEYSLMEGENKVHVIKTSKGELKQIVKPGIGAGTIIKRYINSLEDLMIFTEYVRSWQIEPIVKNIEQAKLMKDAIGNKGIIVNGYSGTPLGMMYRLYADIERLIYMTFDEPEKVQELFDIMEEKYQQGIEFIFKEVPEIDVFIGMDDTSTTIISPSMFEKYNIKLTDQRADLAQKYDRIYLHHSCGLIKDLLPIYRKTKMVGVHAFTPPPVGNVTYKEGRQLLGPNISICSNYESGFNLPDSEHHKKIVSQRCEEAREAQHVLFYPAAPDDRHGIDFIREGIETALKFQKY